MAAKRLYKPNYISIVNIAADEALMPEFIQGDVTGESLSSAVTAYLNDPDLRQQTSQKLIAQTDAMKGKGGSASERAALTVLDIIGA